MKRKTLMIMFSAVILMLIFTGCKTEDKSSETPSGNIADKEADIIGEIIDVSYENTLRVLIDSTDGSINGQVWVTINDETVFINAEGKTFVPEDSKALFEIGENASMLSNGTVMESYPMQTSAVLVFID